MWRSCCGSSHKTILNACPVISHYVLLLSLFISLSLSPLSLSLSCPFFCSLSLALSLALSPLALCLCLLPFISFVSLSLPPSLFSPSLCFSGSLHFMRGCHCVCCIIVYLCARLYCTIPHSGSHEGGRGGEGREGGRANGLETAVSSDVRKCGWSGGTVYKDSDRPSVD